MRPDIQEMQRRQEAQNRSQVSLDRRKSSFIPSNAVAESEALPLRNESDVPVPVHEVLITTTIPHIQESAPFSAAFPSSPEVVIPVTRIANPDPVPFQPYTSEIPESEYCARCSASSTSSWCNVPPVRSTCADIGDSYAAPTSLAGQETDARSLPLTAQFHVDTHPLRRSDFATDQVRHHPTAQCDRESYAPFRDAQYSLPDTNTHQTSQARGSTCIRHTPDSASSPELVARMTRISNADPVPFQPNTFADTGLEYYAPSASFSTSSGCDIPRARNSSADFGASNAFPISLTGQETHVRSWPLSSLSYFDTHPLRRSDVGTDPFGHNPVVAEVSPVPLTVAKGRLCTSYGTPYRAPAMGEADVEVGSVEHNPELGSHIFSPTVQPIERWQETHAYSAAPPKDCQGNSTPSLAISGSKTLPLGRVGSVKTVSEDRRSYFDECTMLDVHAHSAMHRSLPDNEPQNSRNESAVPEASQFYADSKPLVECLAHAKTLRGPSECNTLLMRNSSAIYEVSNAVPTLSPGKDTLARPLFAPSSSNIDTDWSRNVYVTTDQLHHIPTAQRGRESHASLATISTLSEHVTHGTRNASTVPDPFQPFRNITFGMKYYARSAAIVNSSNCNSPTATKPGVDSGPSSTLPTRSTLFFAPETLPRPLVMSLSSKDEMQWSQGSGFAANHSNQNYLPQADRESHTQPYDTCHPLSDVDNHESRRAHRQLHKCKFCQKVFADLDQLNQHMQVHSDDCQFHRDDSSQTFSCMLSNSMVRDEDIASSKQPDSKDSQLAQEFEPAYIPQFGSKSYRSSNVPISSTSIQESTTSATSVNLETRWQFDASSESSLTSSDMKILESNVCQNVVQRSHNPTNNNIVCDGGERRYICKTCNKSFSRQDYLVAHNRTHTCERPYSCTICNKAFSQQSTLVQHIRTHTGERPYSCTTCNKAFSQISTIVRHIRTHTGERPYKCDQCEMAFICAGHRAKHIRAKHPGQ